jgi:hypothetical protein
VGEDQERAKPEGDDVEAHGVRPEEPSDKYATEEPPDVEAHTVRPAPVKPNVKPA